MLMSMLPEDLLTEILGEDVDTLKDEFMEDVLSMIPDRDSIMQMENGGMSKY